MRFDNTSLLIVLLAFSSCHGLANAFSISPLSELLIRNPHCSRHSRTMLNMQQQQSGGTNEDARRPGSNLAAATTEYFISDDLWANEAEASARKTKFPGQSSIESFILPVASAALMITGNTVGASMLVLPDLVAGPGPMISFGVFFGAWLMNLISGLTIAQVAIHQHETSGGEVPSSFKEFAEASLPGAANIVSGISILINSLIMAFDIFMAGEIGSSMVGSPDGEAFSYVWATLVAAVVSTQTLGTLSRVASVLVIGLFATFFGLLLPGFAHISDPVAVFASDPTLSSGELVGGLLHMTPVVITTLVFQNIVPTVTRLLDYDRLKIATAVTVGSAIPLFMYLMWCITVLGRGIDTSSLSLGGLFSVFSLITAAGSTLGTSLSLSEEFSTILGDEKKETFSLPSVALPIGTSLMVGHLFSSDITDLLQITGSFGSPVLYGGIPVAMALMMQRQEADAKSNHTSATAALSVSLTSLIPGGVVGLGLLGLGTTMLIGTELVENISGAAM